jgi:uncharacterized iron-regulated membrane protein
MRFVQANRIVHRWGSVLTALPLLVVMVTGTILLLKKEVRWIQPPTRDGVGRQPTLSFDQILKVASSVPEAEIDEWDDVDRLDVRPSRGVIKVRARNRWEIQLDAKTGDILQVAVRRSDLIEDIHTGAILGAVYRLGAVMPTAIVLMLLWLTGLYLFFLPYFRRG